MAKRFIDDEFFGDPFIYALAPNDKLAFLFVMLNARGAVWKTNFVHANILLGVSDFDWRAFRERCGERIIWREVRKDEEAWFLPAWIKWQLGGPLNWQGTMHHMSVVAALAKADMLDVFRQRAIPYIGTPPWEGGLATGSAKTAPPPPPLAGMPTGLKQNTAFVDAWARWCNHLLDHKVTLSNATRQALWTRATRAGAPKTIALIDHAISKGWKSIVWDAELPGGGTTMKEV